SKSPEAILSWLSGAISGLSLLFLPPFSHQVAESSAQKRRGIGAKAIDLTVRSRLPAIRKRRLFVPLALRNDITELVVAEADHHAIRSGKLVVDRWLDGRVGKISARVGRVLHLIENQLRVNFAGNHRDVELAEAEPRYFRAHGDPALDFLHWFAGR